MRYCRRLRPELIEAWVKAHFPDCKPRKNGRELRINSPFLPDTGYNFNINPAKGKCHDWRGDHWAGINPRTGKLCERSFLRFVQVFLNCSYQAALQNVLGDRPDGFLPAGAVTRPEPSECKEDATVALPKGTQPLLGSKSQKLAARVLRWLAGRGISQELVGRYNIMHSGLDAIWPYYEYGQLVYWQSRSSISKRFQFPDLAEGSGKEFLYGFDKAQPARYVILTEAILDSLVLDRQALAIGGAELSVRQISKLKLLGPRRGIILALDNDRAGIEGILTNAGLLSHLGYPLLAAIPPKLSWRGILTKDWNDVGRAVGWQAVITRFKEAIKPLTVQFKVALGRQLEN